MGVCSGRTARGNSVCKEIDPCSRQARLRGECPSLTASGCDFACLVTLFGPVRNQFFNFSWAETNSRKSQSRSLDSPGTAINTVAMQISQDAGGVNPCFRQTGTQSVKKKDRDNRRGIPRKERLQIDVSLQTW